MADFTPPPHPDDNPFAAPEMEVRRKFGPTEVGMTEAETIRRKYLNHEASIQSVGILSMFGGVMCLISGIGVGILSFAATPPPDPNSPISPQLLMILGGAFYLVFGGILLGVGSGLRKLRNWARLTVAIITVLNLIFQVIQVIGLTMSAQVNPQMVGIIVGTTLFGSLIPFYILYLMISAKGKFVTTPEYAEIRAQTPHIRYRISCIIKWLGLFLLAVVAFGVVAALFQGVRR